MGERKENWQIEDSALKTTMQFFADELLPYFHIEGKVVGFGPTEEDEGIAEKVGISLAAVQKLRKEVVNIANKRRCISIWLIISKYISGSSFS